jgi:beta-lactamase class A
MFRILLLLLVLSLTLNIWQYFAPKQQANSHTVSDQEFERLVQRYPLLSKRILHEFPNDILINFLPLRRELREQVSTFDNSFALYFEYLPTGTSIGINEKIEFTAASLLKVPIIMGYYHMLERTGKTDDPEITITKEMIDTSFGGLGEKGDGTKIRLSEAIKLAIFESDNTAIRVVSSQVPQEDFDAVYTGLDIDVMSQDETPLITAKHYSSILKALFFSAVLTKDHSQRLLSMLSQTTFADKLPAGVPQGVPVAHKIGVLDGKLYTDCGIIYEPRRPYLLCMISASDEETARSRIVDISRRVYQYVSKAKQPTVPDTK